MRGGERADCGDGGGCGIVVEGTRAERGVGGPPSGGVTEDMAPTDANVCTACSGFSGAVGTGGGELQSTSDFRGATMRSGITNVWHAKAKS